MDNGGVYFNTYMVQLKVKSLFEKPVLITAFQYLYGAVKRGLDYYA
ncbi:hypothetical protein MODO_2627 [Myroides odoratimimus]|nr:hypothetical protein MODO_2627 [Myroides odoratimimus]